MEDNKEKIREQDFLKTKWDDEGGVQKKTGIEINLGEISGKRDRMTGSISSFSEKFKKINKGLIIGLAGGFFLVAGVLGFYLYNYFVPRDTGFSVSAPDDVLSGTPFNVEVELQNNSSEPLKNITVSALLPEDVFFVSKGEDKKALNKDIGDLEKQGIIKEKIPLVIFGKGEGIRQIEIKISYLAGGLGPSARFEQTKTVELAVREPGIRLDINAPKKVLNKEEFEIQVNYRNVSETDFSGVELELKYPPLFSFKSATTSLSGRTNFWKIGDLPKGASGNIIIRGSVAGSENSFFEIKGIVRTDFFGQKYLISEKVAGLNISSSPLSLRIENTSVKLGENNLISPGKPLRYKIYYKNNSDVGLNDVVIKAKLKGDMFDFSKLRGSFFGPDSDNTITWNVANTPDFRLLEPGTEKSVDIEIETKKTYPNEAAGGKNLVLSVEAEITSPTVPYYMSGDRTSATAKIENKVAGSVAVNSLVVFNDSASGFLNKGSLPPKIGVPVQFTIHWQITNYSSDIKNIEVKSFLQSGALWTGKVKSNTNSKPLYNSRTQEIIWKIDKIPAGKGVNNEPAEAIFQIEITPSVNQFDQPVPLLAETTFKALDEFTNAELQSSSMPVNTVSQKEGPGTVKEADYKAPNVNF